jgi:hypothetical protein
MNSIKDALNQSVLKHEDKDAQRQIGVMLFEKILEKRHRRDVKVRICFQAAICLLLALFLVFAFLFSFIPVIPQVQTVLNTLLLSMLLLFIDTCQKVINVFMRSKAGGL